jgi:hypothetical protein
MTPSEKLARELFPDEVVENWTVVRDLPGLKKHQTWLDRCAQVESALMDHVMPPLDAAIDEALEALDGLGHQGVRSNLSEARHKWRGGQ